VLSERIEDYCVAPYDLDDGRSVAFDHDFLGRAALEKHAENPAGRKVTLVWNSDDVAAAIGSLFQPGTPAKNMSLLKSRYGLYQAGEVLRDGARVGISLDRGYMANKRIFASLATIDVAAAELGTEMTFIEGEQPPSCKPQVEPHRQVSIRATVAPAPMSPSRATTIGIAEPTPAPRRSPASGR
jgi:vanillate/3-O-methylgallate O-demethylase